MSEMERMVFECDDGEFIDIERMWVESLGDDEYRVENVPMMCNGVSVGDVVKGAIDGDELTFVRVLRPSGHSVVRIACEDSLDGVLQSLERLGCRSERASPEVCAIDVPVTAAWQDVRAVLDAAVARGCTVEDANVSDAHRRSATC